MRRTSAGVARCFGLAAALAVTACATVEPSAENGQTPEIPADAIAVAPELYMRPMGTDERGCALFQPWSPSMAVVQALHWRTPEGDFTLDRGAADCPDDASSDAPS